MKDKHANYADMVELFELVAKNVSDLSDLVCSFEEWAKERDKPARIGYAQLISKGKFCGINRTFLDANPEDDKNQVAVGKTTTKAKIMLMEYDHLGLHVTLDNGHKEIIPTHCILGLTEWKNPEEEATEEEPKAEEPAKEPETTPEPKEEQTTLDALRKVHDQPPRHKSKRK